jgi:signal peptidase II
VLRGNVTIAGLGLCVFVMDQVSKHAISSWLPHGGSRIVIDGFFSLVHARNTGMAFSLFADAAPWFRDFVLPAGQLVIVVAVVGMFRMIGAGARLSRIALVLVLGGAAGNLYDRLLHGYVTDFLDFYVASYHWPAFNVADSAITIGAALLVLESMLGHHSADEPARAA